MRLGDLVDGLGALGVRGDGTVEITGVSYDSRRVAPGDLYCCVPGASADGHDFAEVAVTAGAAALLVERWLDAPAPQVLVPRVRDAMGPVASRLHGEPSRRLTVLGVTGTNGKTTTTYLLEAIGRAAGLVPGVVGTVETRIGGAPLPGGLTTPEAPDLQALFTRMIAEDVGLVAVEVSSHALERGRVEGTWFAVATFLNLSHDHLDFHGSLDAYFEAKARLFEPTRAAAAAVNVADLHGRDLAMRCRDRRLRTVTFAPTGGRGAADVTAAEVDLRPDGTSLVLVAPAWDVRRPVRSQLVGSFNVANTVAAAATALTVGLDPDAVVAGLEADVRVPGRFERVDRGQDFTAVVDYAHTPDALVHALAAAREVGEGRVLVVFGCGGDRDREKRPAMGRAAAEGADAVYVTSDNPRSEDPAAILDQIVGGIPETATPVVELDRRAAIAAALADARAGDVVVVAGKGHETGQIVGDTVRPFDDRQVVAEELERLGASGPPEREVR